jgi:hypothetical protein
MLRAEHDRTPPVKHVAKPNRVSKIKPVAKPKRVKKDKRVAKHVAKYIHPTYKWIALRTKMREARLREEGLLRAKMVDIRHKTLPDKTDEHPYKYIVQQASDTPVDVPAAVTPKH